MASSPNCRNTATSSVNIGASLLPAGIPSTSQHDRQRSDDIGPVLSGGRGLRLGATTLGCSAALSALRAWLRCQPVLAHNSSRILLLAAPIRHHVADRGHLGHCSALGQRQPHHLGLPRPALIPQVGTPHARILNEATNSHFARIKGDSTRVDPCTIERMFESLDDAGVVAAIGVAARQENAACARRLAAMGELYARRAPEDETTASIGPLMAMRTLWPRFRLSCISVGVVLGASCGMRSICARSCRS